MSIDHQAERQPAPWIITIEPVQLDTSAVEGFPHMLKKSPSEYPRAIEESTKTIPELSIV